MREFYGGHFIGQWPDDTETRQISRTVGEDQVVDELLMSFTHDRALEIMLPGIPPTGRRIEVPVVVVVGFEDGKVQPRAHLLGPGERAGPGRPARPERAAGRGVEQAEALLDQGRPKNELLA